MAMEVVKSAADAHHRSQIIFPEQGRTQQSFRDQCDVNQIMKRFEETGVLNHVSQFAAQYGDFSRIGDYHSAVNAVMNAQGMFDALPAHIRKYFANDPGNLLEAIGDPDRHDDLVDLGLVAPETPEDAPRETQPEKKVANKAPPPKADPDPDPGLLEA